MTTKRGIGTSQVGTFAKPYAREAGRRAVQDQLDRLGIQGNAEGVQGYPGHYRMSRSSPPGRRVSVVIPTIGKSPGCGVRTAASWSTPYGSNLHICQIWDGLL